MMKNKKIANIVKILLKSILACALFVCVWFVLTPYFRMDHNDDGDMFRNLDDNCIDVRVKNDWNAITHLSAPPS